MKNCMLSNVLFFAAGAAVGSLVTWKLVKGKYEKIACEEIESIREMYESKSTSNSDEEEEEELDDEEKYEQLIKEAQYRKYEPDTIEEKEDDDDMIEPYVIVPEEFDENGYETVTLFYYADGVLAYGDNNEVVEDVGELVCEDFADHFGEYEDDSVFVRNDNLETDFEILRDNRKFSEVD